MSGLYRSAQADEPAGTLHLVENELPEPGPGQVRVSVEAAGICHSDAAMISGRQPGAIFPLVPGHEIAGRIDAVGDSVRGFAPGERAYPAMNGPVPTAAGSAFALPALPSRKAA
jgi:alcohol dehydrogenase